MAHKKMTKDTLYYIPCGWLVLEKASVDSSVVYGVRKSFFWDTMAAKQAYAHAKELSEPSPTLSAKVQLVIYFRRRGKLWEARCMLHAPARGASG